MKQAAMEVWDLHANEPISEQRKYTSLADAQEMAGLVHDVAKASRNREYVLAVVDGGVDMFFKRYSNATLRELIEKAGLSRDDLIEFANILAPNVISALRANGVLIWLKASADVIVSRIEGGTERPSLTGTESFTDEVAEVLDRRTPKYAAAAQYEIDTDPLTPEQVAASVIEIWERR